MKEKFVNLFAENHALSRGNELSTFNDVDFKRAIKDSYQKVLECFVFKLYLLKFDSHTFMDADASFNIVKTEIPDSYQISLNISLLDDKEYTINNAVKIIESDSKDAQNRYNKVKIMLDNSTLEDLINYIEKSINGQKKC